MKRKLNENDIPEAINNDHGKDSAQQKLAFGDLGLDARLLQAVSREKFSIPTPVQAKAIPLALSGKDVLTRAKTGSGKTLAYALPLLQTLLYAKSSTTSCSNTSALVLVPTKELAHQVTRVLQSLTTSISSPTIRCENITRKEDHAVTRARLVSGPNVVVATPSQASRWVNQEGGLKLDHLEFLVVDEADLLMSYGYGDDLKSLQAAIPKGVVAVCMVSATLSDATRELTQLFCGDKAEKPTVLDLSEEEAKEEQRVEHYVLRTSEEDKFLLIYAIFKLQLIKGKVIVFVGGEGAEGGGVDRCYRVRLFLEQFGTRSVVLNQEMPVNSRQHVVEEFNRGVYDILIAADEGQVVGEGEPRKKKRRKPEAEKDEEEQNGESGGEPNKVTDTTVTSTDLEEESAADNEPVTKKTRLSKANQTFGQRHTDTEYTPSRGLDFRHVSCVLNFDLPASAKSYTHRTGRTARGGQTGMVLSFYVPKEVYRKHKPTSIPQCAKDEEVVQEVKKAVKDQGGQVKEWEFEMQKLEGFRYRFTDALRSVTRIAVREARTRELRNELIKSERLKRHFEENPQDLKHLRHDGAVGHGVRMQPHLRHVPDYLLPEGGKASVKKDVGFVGLRKDRENRIRKARAFKKGQGKVGRGKGRGVDPLKSLNVQGRSKK